MNHLSHCPIRSHGATIRLVAFILLLGAVVHPRAELVWTVRNLGGGMYDAMWTGEMFVAVGDGAIITSSDGMEWTGRASVLGTTWYSVCKTGNGIVAVGLGWPDAKGHVITSVDGYFWKQQPPLSDESLNAVVWTGTRIVAAGDSGTIYTSDNGTAWLARNSGERTCLRSLAYADGLIIAVGENGTVLTSTDGTAWTKTSDSATVRSDLNAVCRAGNQWIVAGDSGTILTSSNGENWTVQKSSTTKNLADLFWNGTRIIATGDTAITSIDGSLWNFDGGIRVRHPYWAIASNGVLNVATGSDIYTSTDLTSWTCRTLGPESPSILEAVIEHDGLLMAVGNGCCTSADNGETWRMHKLGTTKRLYDLTWYNNQFVAVGEDGEIRISPDGITWTGRTSGTGATFLAVAASDSVVVAVGDSGRILSSADGDIWERSVSHYSRYFRDVIFVDSQFFAVGDDSTVLTSPDGSTWTTSGWVTGRRSLRLLYTTDSLVIATGSGTVAFRDGTFRIVDSFFDFSLYYSIARSDAGYAAVGNFGRVALSEDGWLWTAADTVFSWNWDAITSFGGRWIAVGNGGGIIVSKDEIVATRSERPLMDHYLSAATPRYRPFIALQGIPGSATSHHPFINLSGCASRPNAAGIYLTKGERMR